MAEEMLSYNAIDMQDCLMLRCFKGHTRNACPHSREALRASPSDITFVTFAADLIR